MDKTQDKNSDLHNKHGRIARRDDTRIILQAILNTRRALSPLTIDRSN